ncbi:hypothetical protein [Vagococcus bubulae]|uniref:Uncharacterized protein n=1 Tax=Vagococcus bubulae TaxID=1977868 RepID=A0A429ZEW0_9ENTE|nr:hypothetical protein [Vagococcus bubulae]RST92195.1 hypothetical protein CBF36_08900 [Vagococcus bubulae]
MEEKQQEETQKKKRWILLLLLLLLLVIGGFFVYKIFFDKPTEVATVVAGDFLPEGKDASKMTEKEMTKYAQQAVDKSNFNMRIISEAHFNKETMTGGLAIQNPPQNSQPVNVVVTLDSDNSVVYESGAIQPGEEIKEATLTQKLNPGSYPVTATFDIYNPDTKKKQGQVKALLTLIVDK